MSPEPENYSDLSNEGEADFTESMHDSMHKRVANRSATIKLHVNNKPKI